MMHRIVILSDTDSGCCREVAMDVNGILREHQVSIVVENDHVIIGIVGIEEYNCAVEPV